MTTDTQIFIPCLCGASIVEDDGHRIESEGRQLVVCKECFCDLCQGAGSFDVQPCARCEGQGFVIEEMRVIHNTLKTVGDRLGVVEQRLAEFENLKRLAIHTETNQTCVFDGDQKLPDGWRWF